MAKGSLLMGKQTGKLGESVLAVSGGVQIQRAYNPNVANPNTALQVRQRSKLKLMSQLAAAMAGVIVFQKSGLVSARNKFISANIDLARENGGIASVTYENLQLADGNRGLPAIQVVRSNANGLQLSLQSTAASAVDRVVYNVFKKTSESQLQLLSSTIIEDAGDAGTFPATLPYAEGELAIYAYGMKDSNAAATAKYGNYAVSNGVDLAQLYAQRSLSASDYAFTQTRGTTLFSGEDTIVTPDAGQVMIYVTASGNGTVAGTGFVGNRKAVDIGDPVTVTATPDTGATFVAWRKNGQSANLSTSATYTFNASENLDLVAIFSGGGNSGGGAGDAD